MKTKLLNILHMNNFFNIIKTSHKDVIYVLKRPSRILLKNIFVSWLKFLNGKTQNRMHVYINKNIKHLENKSLPFGILTLQLPDYNDQTELRHSLDHYAPENDTKLDFSILLPHRDYMQHFIQWQRYRKYWWSSISTTPSLFTISDIQQDNKQANVNVLAQFPFGPKSVECITVTSIENFGKSPICSILKCSMSLEGALFVLLFDGCTNYNKEQCIKLHLKMSPYKFAFAIDLEGSDHLEILSELSKLLHYKLQKISSFLPNFSSPLENQLNEISQMAVPYVAILNKNTLENGIFHLMNVNTMLKEQVHVADFDSYAALLCNEK